MKGKWRANSDIRNGKSNSAFDDGKATKEKWVGLVGLGGSSGWLIECSHSETV